MNLKQRMRHQNNNNSSLGHNNSGYPFDKAQDDLMYEKSRRECEEELFKRKNQLEYEQNNLRKQRERQFNSILQKFSHDYEELRKQILNNIDQNLTQNKNRIVSQIKERRSVESSEEAILRKDMDEMLSKINSYITGLKKNDQYRQYIAKIVTTDFDTKKQEIKSTVRKIKYSPVATGLDQRHFSCLKNDASKVITVDYNSKRDPYLNQAHRDREVNRQQREEGYGLHENRDKLKKYF